MGTVTSRIVAYVDGFNLYHGLHARRGRRDLWLDVESLLDAKAGQRPGQALTAVRYFTAMVHGAGRARQQTYLDALIAHGDRTTVHLGRFQRKEQRCWSCGVARATHEEKESDVAVAVQAVEDVAAGEADQVWYVSGDSDLCPSVRAVRRINPQVRTVALFPPHRSSADLSNAVHGTLRIFDKEPKRHQFPDRITTSEGTVLARPAHWI
jgi:uncharacterized LabA/DUF88 family protein